MDTKPKEWQNTAINGGLSQSFLNQRAVKLRTLFNYVLNVYYNGVDNYGNQIEESYRVESFESRWNKARAILLKSI